MLRTMIAADRAARHWANNLGVQIANDIIKAMTEPNPTLYLWAPKLRQRLGSIGERIIANAKAEPPP